MCGLDHKVILKHVPTRWLSIGRFLENWTPLKEFFREEQQKSATKSAYASSKTKRISEALTSPSTRLYCIFLRYAAGLIEQFLTENQAEAPKIHRLHQSMSLLLREILLQFVNPAGLARKQSWEVDFTLPYNVKSDKELLIREAARRFIADKSRNGLSDSRLQEFYAAVVDFYRTAATYIRDNLPFEDPLMRQIQICRPESITEPPMLLSHLPALLERFPCLLPKGATADSIYRQFADLQTFEFLAFAREDELWAHVMKQEKDRFSHICQFILALLTIPHSSAHCERIFSCVRKTKTEFRASMGNELLEALMVLKHRPGSWPRSYTPATLRHLKGSTRRALAGVEK